MFVETVIHFNQVNNVRGVIKIRSINFISAITLKTLLPVIALSLMAFALPLSIYSIASSILMESEAKVYYIKRENSPIKFTLMNYDAGSNKVIHESLRDATTNNISLEFDELSGCRLDGI